MKLQINGESADVRDRITLAELLAERGQADGGAAAAVNGAFVPRSAYAQRVLAPGDEVEIVAPMQGG